MFPTLDLPNINTRQVIYPLEDILATGLGYTDLTGKFIYTSSRGNSYILIMYHYDGNAILSQMVKDLSPCSLAKAYKSLHASFAEKVTKPDMYALSKE